MCILLDLVFVTNSFYIEANSFFANSALSLTVEQNCLQLKVTSKVAVPRKLISLREKAGLLELKERTINNIDSTCSAND